MTEKDRPHSSHASVSSLPAGNEYATETSSRNADGTDETPERPTDPSVALQESLDPRVRYRYYQGNGLLLDRDQVVLVRDLRRVLPHGSLKIVLAQQIAPVLIKEPDEQAAFLAWYLQPPPSSASSAVPLHEEKPYVRIGNYVLLKQQIHLLMESPIEGDDTLFIRSGLPLNVPLTHGKDPSEEVIETIELRGRSANTMQQWLEDRVETLVAPVKLPAYIPPKNMQHLVLPACPHCDCLLTPRWDSTQGRLHLTCMICGNAIGPFTSPSTITF